MHVPVQVELEPVQALQECPVCVAEGVLGRTVRELAQAAQPRTGRVMFAEKALELLSLYDAAHGRRGEQVRFLGDVFLELARLTTAAWDGICRG